MARHMHVHNGVKQFLEAFPRDAHPMAILSGAVSALSTFYPESVGSDEHAIELATVLLLAKSATVIAYLQRRAAGRDIIEPVAGGHYVTEFLRLGFSDEAGSLDVDPVVRRALDLLLILHADHEQNCSTSTVRIVGSSHANIYASVSAGVGALSGPLHGGANEAALRMFDDIKASGDTIEQFVAKVKDKAEGARLMGFGHRVYKSYDPRGAVVKKVADELLEHLGADGETFEMAKRLEEIALSDEYFIERKLYPNVDFYTGLLYSAMGFPTPMFTPLFALGRMPGWIAHYREMLNDSRTKIGRPRQIYIGEVERDYVALAAATRDTGRSAPPQGDTAIDPDGASRLHHGWPRAAGLAGYSGWAKLFALVLAVPAVFFRIPVPAHGDAPRAPRRRGGVGTRSVPPQLRHPVERGLAVPQEPLDGPRALRGSPGRLQGR